MHKPKSTYLSTLIQSYIPEPHCIFALLTSAHLSASIDEDLLAML